MTFTPVAPPDLDVRRLLEEHGPERAADRLLALSPGEVRGLLARSGPYAVAIQLLSWIVVLLSGGSTPALAGPPYTVDDPATLAHRGLGAQLYGNAAVSRAGVPVELAWGAGATYSLFRNTDLLLQVGRSLRGAHSFNLYAGVLTRLNR